MYFAPNPPKEGDNMDFIIATYELRHVAWPATVMFYGSVAHVLIALIVELVKRVRLRRTFSLRRQ